MWAFGSEKRILRLERRDVRLEIPRILRDRGEVDAAGVVDVLLEDAGPRRFGVLARVPRRLRGLDGDRGAAGPKSVSARSSERAAARQFTTGSIRPESGFQRAVPPCVGHDRLRLQDELVAVRVVGAHRDRAVRRS